MIRTLIITGVMTTILSLFACSEGKKKDDRRMNEAHTDLSKASDKKYKTMNIKNFKENWGLTAIPTELEKLIEFQNNVSAAEFYSQGFAVTIDDKLGLKSWSNDPSFLDKLYPFAQANGTGSFYAIWSDGTSKPISEMPIVVFGDEGGAHIVAKNILQLLQLLAADTEITVEFDRAYFYKSEGYSEEYYEDSRDRNKFLKWLQEEFDLTQIEDPAKIIASAQEIYKQQFDKWFEQYYKIG